MNLWAWPRKLYDQCCCLSFCEQDYWNSAAPISLKLDVMIGPTNQKNWLTFGADPVPDTDSGSLFHFITIAEWGILDKFISISHIVTGQFLRYLATDADKRMNTTYLGSGPADVRIQINPEIQIWIPYNFCLRFCPWQRLVLSEHGLGWYAVVVNTYVLLRGTLSAISV